MVKVVSFSLWGSDEYYTIGMLKNTDLVKQYYPHFECWIYIHKPSVPVDIINKLSKKDNVKIFFKEGNLKTTKPMMWRFEPITDKNVEIFLSRDSDSRIFQREVVAVQEWIQSDKLLHIMRDHPCHDYKIQGGMWGMKHNNLHNLKQLFDNLVQRGDRNYDQIFLQEVIYPKYIHSAMIHASFHKYEPFAKDFPVPFCKDFLFVGEQIEKDETRIKKGTDTMKTILQRNSI